MIFCGIDIGTTSTKAVVLDENGRVIDEAALPAPAGEARVYWYEHFCQIMDLFAERGRFAAEQIACSVTGQGGSFALARRSVSSGRQRVQLDGIGRPGGRRGHDRRLRRDGVLPSDRLASARLAGGRQAQANGPARAGAGECLLRRHRAGFRLCTTPGRAAYRCQQCADYRSFGFPGPSMEPCDSRLDRDRRGLAADDCARAGCPGGGCRDSLGRVDGCHRFARPVCGHGGGGIGKGYQRDAGHGHRLGASTAGRASRFSTTSIS